MLGFLLQTILRALRRVSIVAPFFSPASVYRICIVPTEKVGKNARFKKANHTMTNVRKQIPIHINPLASGFIIFSYLTSHSTSVSIIAPFFAFCPLIKSRSPGSRTQRDSLYRAERISRTPVLVKRNCKWIASFFLLIVIIPSRKSLPPCNTVITLFTGL